MNLKEKLLSTELIIDNKYLQMYCELIQLNKDTKKELFKTQLHHIIPKCYFKLKNLSCDESDSNLIYLIYKDHVLAHYYLAMCSKNNEFKYMNLCALKYCLNHRDYKKQDYYEYERKLLENLDYYQELYEESRKISALKSSLAQKGKSRKNKGTKFINKDGIYKMVSINELDSYLEDGWSLGGRPLSEKHRQSLLNANLGKVKSQAFKTKMSLIMKNRPISNTARTKISKSSSNRVWINDGEKNYFIKRENLNNSVYSNCTLGRINLKTDKLKLNNLNKGKKVICIETGVIYNSIADACRQTNIKAISKCCKEKRKTAGGYHWKFIN